MSEDEEEFHHQVTPWTVGQLRKSLEGLPDDLPIEVLIAEEPGGDSCDVQVLVDVGFGYGTQGDGSEFIGRELQLSCEFRSGTYYRRRRS